MSQPITVQQCWLTTLSPLHLGSGLDYQPTGYVMKEGYLHAFGDQQLAQGLGANGITKLVEIVAGGDDSALRKVQREIHSQSGKLAALATHSVWAAPGICELYDSRVGQIAQREEQRNAHNKLHIQRTFANPYHYSPVLTGSAIKGAIRTAWLDFLNKSEPLRAKERNQELQQRLLKSGRKVEEDPFYLLKISDASYSHPDSLMPGEIWFAVSRKRKPRPDRAPASIYTMLECIGSWRSRCFGFDMRFLDGPRALRTTSTQVPADRDQVVAASNRYYLPKLVKEMRQLSDAGYLDQHWTNAIRELLAGELGDALKTNGSMLLRLGKHSGAEDKTLNGVRKIKILEGRGKPPSHRSETTEIRLAACNHKDQQGLLPFGWVLVEFPEYPLNDCQAVIRRVAEPVYQRQQQERAWVARRAEARQQASGEAADRAEKEARQRAEKEEEQRRRDDLAKQPQEVQLIEEFRHRFAVDTASKGGGLGSTLGQELRRLAEQAAQWSAEYREAMRQLVREVFGYLNVDRKKNTKAKELWRLLGGG